MIHEGKDGRVVSVRAVGDSVAITVLQPTSTKVLGYSTTPLPWSVNEIFLTKLEWYAILKFDHAADAKAAIAKKYPVDMP
jgi:hypothetical protein